EKVEAALLERFGDRVRTAVQEEQRGTGDAVRCAMEVVPEDVDRVVILYGDCPLVHPETLERLLAAQGDAALALLTSSLDDPSGYGRILRDANGHVTAIREHKDCTVEERAIREVNPGVYSVRASFLRRALGGLSTKNSQGELYLTDVVAMAAAEGSVRDVAGDIDELRGVNDRLELADQAARMRRRIGAEWAKKGVGIEDPSTTYIDADCVLEPDASIAPGVHLRGRCIVRSGARIDVGCVLTDVEVGERAELLPYTVASRSRIGSDSHAGPFTHLRAETDLGPGSKVGNFSETKKTRIGARSKVNHLSYVGDGEIGEDVNIGAGTIFCNYDGVKKHTTTIEDGAFIGSDSQLVAPVRIGKGAYVASGTTVTRDVPD
ncbi:MAG: bifunctional UDP-N-acetylglucosamine diphosphorylase/glucosamine-1-phosphate N-acetyltransferase GlmU, partial [Polyangiaceae bacterium]|nr:bifunctional UDP-N-acetylglucosamine diphosphorylase/glucosamine-1-phosphate N-acetyltransferase GlmU [Polyangiaceae bacterium]